MKNRQEKEQTEQVRDRVLQAVIAAEVAKGHLKWKVSDIARFTKVSRPLIYYHFGKTKEEILKECLAVIAEAYYGLSKDRDESLNDENIVESFRRTRRMYLGNPALGVFYQKHRYKPSPLGAQLLKIEKRFQDKLKKRFSFYSDPQITALHAILHGLMSAPFLDEESFEEAIKMVLLITSARAQK